MRSPSQVSVRVGDLRFDSEGLIPAVVQEAATGEVLMVAWMNAEALGRTLTERRTHFWSRSRQAVWRKGDTSGHVQHVEAVYADCDRDTLLVLVHQDGVACHTGSRSCFVAPLEALEPRGGPPMTDWSETTGALDTLDRVIQSRRLAPSEGSYVARLLAGGDTRVTRKIGEEAAEVIAAALIESPDRLVAEVADLWFHTLVLLGARGLSSRPVLAELARRHHASAAQTEPGGTSAPGGDPSASS